MDLERSKLPLPPHEKTSESDTDSETPLLQSHLSKALSLNNVNSPTPYSNKQQDSVNMSCSYKECLKNHAASIGGFALDGCGEFMPNPNSTSHDPTSLKCAACGCHRSFHRRVTSQVQPPLVVPSRWSSSPSSSPVASPTPHHSIFPSAPHMLLALSTGPKCTPLEENHHFQKTTSNLLSPQQHGRKRARTKFTEEQKQKMHVFAEKLGWKLPRGNEEGLVEEFCSEVGVNKNVFKIWMHNNKHRKDKAIIDGTNSNLNDHSFHGSSPTNSS